MRARLFCLDTVLVDVVLRVAALPARGGDALASEQVIRVGGGFNAMSAATRHELSALYAGRLGTGPFATLAERALASESIETPVERHRALDTGICLVLSEPDGERSFVTAPGAEATLRARDLAQLALDEHDVVLVSGYNVMYPGGADVVLEWLSGLNAVVAFDPATRMLDIPPANLVAALSRATWLLCNVREARALSSAATAYEAATVIAQRDGLNVVVRDGPAGCVVARAGAPAQVVPGFEAEVVDTNGAGDVHNGVFLAELTNGRDAVAAASWANAAAAMAIGVLGPATCPTRELVAAWLSRR